MSYSVGGRLLRLVLLCLTSLSFLQEAMAQESAAFYKWEGSEARDAKLLDAQVSALITKRFDPSVPSLGSADSAPGCPGLFADILATMEGSDFSCLFFIGFDSSSSRCGPLENNSSGQAGDLPVLVQRAFLHARV